MADCQATLNELYAYLDSELSSERASEIITHLKVCNDCQSAFEFHAELKTVIRLKATNDELSGGFIERLQSCLGDDMVSNDIG